MYPLRELQSDSFGDTLEGVSIARKSRRNRFSGKIMAEVSFKVESWKDCRSEMEWLWPLHWAEIADLRIPLNVWMDGYNSIDEQGQLHIVTARDTDGKVVGYHWSVVRPHLHYQQSLTAYTDIYFLHPDYRKGMNGINLFKFVEQSLKERGVGRMYTASKVKLDMSPIFERLGWQKSETVYTKVLI